MITIYISFLLKWCHIFLIVCSNELLKGFWIRNLILDFQQFWVCYLVYHQALQGICTFIRALNTDTLSYCIYCFGFLCFWSIENALILMTKLPDIRKRSQPYQWSLLINLKMCRSKFGRFPCYLLHSGWIWLLWPSNCNHFHFLYNWFHTLFL